MKRILLALTAIVALASCKEAGQSEWDTLCRWVDAVPSTGLSCEGIDPPKVVYFKQKDKPRLYGYYTGGKLIYISDSLSKNQESSTVFHETVHYLQVMSAGLKVPGPAKQVCKAEAQAFRITDVYRDAVLGMSRVGPNWWKPYWYCWQYYAPQGSKMIILELPDGEVIIDVMTTTTDE